MSSATTLTSLTGLTSANITGIPTNTEPGSMTINFAAGTFGVGDGFNLNIDITNGLVMSEAVMMGLGPYIGREYAHDLVYDICRRAIAEDRPLIDLLADHPEINRHLDRTALAALCDPTNYLGQAGVMVDRVLERWR